ncbi:unnamed protein product [Effrenium voratum]|nr:unnamed protein product [Effrenium voratum]
MAQRRPNHSPITLVTSEPRTRGVRAGAGELAGREAAGAFAMAREERAWAAEPPRSGKSIFQKAAAAGTFLRPTTAPTTTRFDPVPGLPNLVQGIPASPRKQLVPAAHRMPSIPVRGATPSGPWAECRSSASRRAVWPRQGTENSLMFRSPLERRAAHEGWGEEVSICASPRPMDSQALMDRSNLR